MKVLFSAILTALALAGCGTMDIPGFGSVGMSSADAKDIMANSDTAEVKLFREKVKAAREFKAPPILKITAQDGKTMEFKNVASIEVNVPPDPAIVQSLLRRDPSTWETIADYTLKAASILVNPYVALQLGHEAATTQRLQIETSSRDKEVMFGTFQGVATGAYNQPVYKAVEPSEKPLYQAVTPGEKPLYGVEVTSPENAK